MRPGSADMSSRSTPASWKKRRASPQATNPTGPMPVTVTASTNTGWCRRFRSARSTAVVAVGIVALGAAQQEVRREAAGDQRVDDRVDVTPVLRLDHDVELGALDRGIVEQPL